MYLNDWGRRASCLDGPKLRLNAKGQGHAGTLGAWPHATGEKLRGCASQRVEGPFLGAWRTPSQSAVLLAHGEGLPLCAAAAAGGRRVPAPRPFPGGGSPASPPTQLAGTPLSLRFPQGRGPVAPPTANVRNVPPQSDARAAPGRLRGLRGGRSAGGGVRAEVGVCGREREGSGGWAQRGAAGSPAGGRRPRPALSAEDGSDDSSRGGHFLLGWMRRSRRRRGGDRTEDGPCRGEVGPGLAADPCGRNPRASAGTAALRLGPPGGPRPHPAGLTQRGGRGREGAPCLRGDGDPGRRSCPGAREAGGDRKGGLGRGPCPGAAAPDWPPASVSGEGLRSEEGRGPGFAELR